MKYFRYAFDLYINSSTHVATAVVCFAAISMVNYGLYISWELLAFIFSSSITGYNFVKYAGIARFDHSSLTGNLRFIQVFSLFNFVAMIILAFKLPFMVLLVAGVLGVFTLLYALPVLGDRRNLRSLAGLKIFVIAVVWAGTTVLLPVYNAGEALNLSIFVDMLQRVGLVIVLILPFEIRDLKYDSRSLETIPQQLGVMNTKLLGLSIILVISLLEILQENRWTVDLQNFLLVCTIIAAFLWASKERQSKYFASFWVEAIPVLHLGIVLFSEHVLLSGAY